MVLRPTNGPLLDYPWEVTHGDNIIAQTNGLVSAPLFLGRQFLLHFTPDTLIGDVCVRPCLAAVHPSIRSGRPGPVRDGLRGLSLVPTVIDEWR